MTLINILFLGILPTALLMWLGNVVRSRGADDKAGKRWLLFLLGGLGISIVILVIAMSISEYVFSLSIPVLLPILFGFTTASCLHLARERNLSAGIATLLSLTLLLFLSWITLANNWMVLLLILLIGALTALAWLVWDRMGKQYLLFFAIEAILLGISIRVTDMNRISNMTPHWLTSIASTGSYLIVPWAGIVLSALLIRRLLSSGQPLNWKALIPTLLMVATLFLMIGYQAMLLSMWDVATDGLGWIFLWLTASTIGIGSAMLMTWSMPRKQLWVAILFALIVPSMLLEARNIGTYDQNHTWGTTPIITTERRADKIDKAIQRYYERNNEYPQSLSDLVPLYIPYIPNPFIIPGQDWCYQGRSKYYRFGYVYRKVFSTPAFIRIHSSVGEWSNTSWGCQDEADSIPVPYGF